jgi:CRP-like cAMP-binding protein
MTDDLSQKEQMAYQYAAQGKTEHAVKLLFDLIVAYAKAKNFPKAEALREKLFEVDAMALNEIIKAAEIIEEEKSVAIDRNHLDIWAELYKTLTKEESNALYFSLKTAEYGPDEMIFQQGSRNERLYFINHGQLKLVYGQAGRQTLLRTVEPGMIAGEDTFFFITFCTNSLITISNVKLSYLEREDYQKWQTEFVSLASKLADHCARLKKAYDIAGKKSFNRREHKRINVSGPIMFQVMNASGGYIGKPFKGELSDISVGGLSFFIKTASQKNALMLLGRKIEVKFRFAIGKSHIDIERTGVIIGVINHLFSDYSVHFRFDNLLSDVVVEKLGAISHTEKEPTAEHADKSAY